MQLPKKTVGASNKMMSPVLPGKARPVPAAFARPSYSTIAQQKPLPKAPPVFRLRPTASAAQAKLAHPVSSQPSKLVAPPVFKLSLLQRTVAPANNSARLAKTPQAPAVYRPQPPSAPLQAKPTTSPRDTGQVRVSAPMRAGKGSYRITAGAGGQQVGSVMVHERDRSSIEVTDLGVNSAHRKQGLGNALIASALRAGLQMGKTRVVLNSQDNGSGRLTNWYQGMGFVRTGGSRRGYPQLEASISRVLSKVAQRQITPVSSLPQANSAKGFPVQRQTANVGQPQLKLTPAKLSVVGGVSAPAVYRPQPLPRSLQAKMMATSTALIPRREVIPLHSFRWGVSASHIIQRMDSGDEGTPLSPNSAYIWGDISSEESSGDEWDPADHAEDPLVAEDYQASKLRKGLSFNSTAKGNMKNDTPKRNGNYICHICGNALKKGQGIDMDHIPAWQDRVKALFKVDMPTSEDDISNVVLAKLYNMRGSVFAHSSCNRNHSGEGNWVQMWKSVEAWYIKGGGPAIDKNKY